MEISPIEEVKVKIHLGEVNKFCSLFLEQNKQAMLACQEMYRSPLQTEIRTTPKVVADGMMRAGEVEPESGLNPLEVAVIELFVSAVKMLGIPKSVAEIYGLLFLSNSPMPLDVIVERLSISKGSVSQGLKLLRGLGGVKVIYVAGDRRDHYVAETELKKLVSGFIRGEVQPRLESGESRLERLKEISQSLGENAETEEFYRARVGKLRQWHQRSSELMPLIGGLLSE